MVIGYLIGKHHLLIPSVFVDTDLHFSVPAFNIVTDSSTLKIWTAPQNCSYLVADIYVHLADTSIVDPENIFSRSKQCARKR